MTWKPHWCEHAMAVARDGGWKVAENAQGQLEFVTPDDKHRIVVNFDEANRLAADPSAADAAAVAAIDTAAGTIGRAHG